MRSHGKSTGQVVTRAAIASLALITALSACKTESAVTDVAAVGELRPARSVVFDGAVDFALALPNERVLYANGEDLVLVDGMDRRVVSSTSLLGDLITWTVIDDVALLAGRNGTFALRGSDFFRSELASAIDGMNVTSLVSVPRRGARDDLYIAHQGGLALLRDGRLQDISLEGVTLSAPVIGSAPFFSGRSLWVSVPAAMTTDEMSEESPAGALYELAFDDDDALTASKLAIDFAPSQMAADASGVLWLLDEESGEVVAIELSRTPTRYRFPFMVDSLQASSAGPDSWFGGEGRLFHHAAGVFNEVEGVDRIRAVGADGTILSGSGSLERRAARHPATWNGPSTGSVLVRTTSYEIVLTQMSAVESITANIDGEEIDVTSDRSVSVDPATLESGAHALEAVIRYTDGTLPTTARVVFEIGVRANWNDDVNQVYLDHCSDCHHATGGGRRLDRAEDWINDFDQILINVKEARMPLGRDALDSKTIALIEAWGAADFPADAAAAGGSTESAEE